MPVVRSNDDEQSQHHVSNPSVSVSEDAEGTYTVDLFLSYSDGDSVHPELSANSTLADLKKEADNEKDVKQKKILNDDIDVVDILGGYHKIVAVKLVRALKGINCDSDAKKFVDTLDNLSAKIVNDISKYRLLLIEKGKYMEKDPTYESVKDFCYKGKRLKTVYQQK